MLVHGVLRFDQELWARQSDGSFGRAAVYFACGVPVAGRVMQYLLFNTFVSDTRLVPKRISDDPRAHRLQLVSSDSHEQYQWTVRLYK